jgi:hypothetical protein
MLVLAVIRCCFVDCLVLVIAYLLNEGSREWAGNWQAGIAPSGLNMEQHTKHMPAKAVAQTTPRPQ